MYKIIKKFNWQHLVVLIFLLSMVLMPYLVFAQADQGPDTMAPNGGFTKTLFTILGENAGFETGRQNSIGNVVASVINAILSLVGVIFLGQMVYGGYLWMTARGSDEQVEKARKLIQQSIIGIIIIVAAYAIVYFVLNALLGPGNTAGPGGSP